MRKRQSDRLIPICTVPRWKILKTTLNNLSFEEFVERASSDPNAVILDVRTPEEFLTGSMANSININYLAVDLADQLEALPRDKTYYVLCRTSRRSIRICVILKNAGFEHVYNMDIGLQNRTFESVK